MFEVNSKVSLGEGFLQDYYAERLKDFMEREGVTKYDINQKTGLHYDTITHILNSSGYNIKSLEKIMIEFKLVDMD